MNPIKLTPNQALPKIKQFCAYQERCHQEVKDKLYGFGLHLTDVDTIISKLIEENYLNEERFALHYAGGKFRMKQWGRVKIKYALKEKHVSDYCIKKALASIDDNDYFKTLERITEIKLKSLKSEKNIFIKKRKMQDYLTRKGYEFSEIKEIMDKLSK